jgi:hypothetical protein
MCAKFFCKIFFENCFLWSGYGAGTSTGTVTCQKSEPELEKIGTVPQYCLKGLQIRAQIWFGKDLEGRIRKGIIVKCTYDSFPVFRIHDILMWIRILLFSSLT